LAHFTLSITFLFFPDNFEVIKSVYFLPKERSKSVTDPLIIPHPSRLSLAELPVLGGPKRSLLIDGTNPYHFRSIQCFAFYKMLKKRELLRKTNYNFIKIDLNFPATLASLSFELATLGIESKTLNPTAREAYTIKKL
jgi:hypothetical protein